MKQPTLFDGEDEPAAAVWQPPDQAARDFAIDPRNHVVLEASAGTGKTRVLVDRYVKLLASGVEPRHILAMTFTRKAAAEMRERVLATLRQESGRGTFPAAIWRSIQSRMGDIEISTIDGFCFGLLREFPLEADVDPAFEVADETETARFAGEALDLSFRAARALIDTDECLRLLFVRVKLPVLRDAIGALIDRRAVAFPAIARFVDRHRAPSTSAEAGERFVDRVRNAIGGSARVIIDDGPHAAPEFRWLAADLRALAEFPSSDPVRIQHLRRRLERYFLTKEGKARQRLGKPFSVSFGSTESKKRHEQALKSVSPAVAFAIDELDGDLNRLLARGVLRLLTIAVSTYDRLLEEHALLDFGGMLDRAVTLLERQEEFSRSRLKLQSRYHHLLVDEFQDTSRRQWRLVELLIDAWAEGEGAADAATSVFVVGDRKQSIYRFRHAEVTLLDEASRRIAALRPGRAVRQAISTSFRAVPELLAFVNALSAGMTGDETLADRWQYADTDRFPTPEVGDGARRDGRPVLGLVSESSIEASAAAVADEIVRLLHDTPVRDRREGMRPARPDDIAILFRARAGHQYFEEALETRGVRTYVYKGLGFFDAPEVQDLQALMRFLAQPDSDLRAAEFLRSRFVRLSDVALAELAPSFSAVLLDRHTPPAATLSDVDAGLLARVRDGVHAWLALADRVPPGELIDRILEESAYLFELRGRRLEQARENVKKVRSLVRRVENRGYATIGRLAAYFETLRAGDDSNAIVEAAGAVNLMTIHAAKGLEFPIVFVVNMHAPGRGRPIGFSVIEQGPSGEPEVAFNSTDATALEEQRELEELRRLVYVAATRARDRLYLAAEVDRNGRLRKGQRSLASLLPATLGSLFSAAALVPPGPRPEIDWTSERGTFAFAICRPALEPEHVAPDAPPPVAPELSLTPVLTSDPFIETATTALELDGASDVSFAGVLAPAAPATRSSNREDDRLVGTLVHRMLARRLETVDDVKLIRRTVDLLRPAERVDLVEPLEVARAAVDLYRLVVADPALGETLASGTSYYEVPFSYFPAEKPGTCIRGAVDCLVVAPDGSATVLEFKTGAPRPEHQAQAELYARAMAAILKIPSVVAKVVYPAPRSS